jgi:serine/threonine protein kinase
MSQAMDTILKYQDIIKIKKILKNVQVDSKLGTSALGSIYQITHPKYGMCVLKILDGRGTQNPKFLKRFLQSVVAAQTIEHHNFAKIYEVGEENDFFIIREWVPGKNLQQRTTGSQKLSLHQANNIILQLTLGLEAAYTLGLVHKNLKPTNLIVDNKDNLKIVDFSLPPTTPYYLSPEQCEGKQIKAGNG